MPISQNYGRITTDWLNVLVLNLKHNDTPEHHEQMKSFFKLHKHEEQTVLLHYSRPQLLLCSVPFHVWNTGGCWSSHWVSFFKFFFRFLGNAVWANMFVNLCRDMKILVSQIPCFSCFLFCIDPPGKNVPGLCCQQSKGEDKSVGAVLQSSSFQSASRTKLYPIVCVFLCRLHLANEDL